MRKLALFAAFLSASAAASAPAAPPPPAAAAPPRLVIVISVDQFSADLFDEHRPQFTGGLARLAGGTVFRNAYQSHAATETCPGHSTLLTGDRPATTGIIANSWYDARAPRPDKVVYCAEDETVPGTSSTAYKVAPVHLRVKTLGDLLKTRSPASRMVVVAGKDRAAVMMGGHAPDQRWYWNDKAFVTDLPAAARPARLDQVNAAVAAAVAAGTPPLDPPPYCAARGKRIALPGGKAVGDGRLARAPGDAGSFRASPQYDGAVLALAAALVGDLGLGRGSSPDVLAIGLSATDYVGHTFGPGGQEMCLQLMSVDRDLGDFFALLDKQGVDYAVALTADHGGLDIPERLRAKGVADAAWVDPALAPAAIGGKVAAQLGIAMPLIVSGGPSGEIYLNPALSLRDRKRARVALLAAYRAHPQVAKVLTKAQIAATPMPRGNPVQWTLAQRVRASFDPARSGDLYLILKPHIMPIIDMRGYVATHGSAWDYDRRVPILLWRKGQAPSTHDEPIETVDLMPTLSAMIDPSAKAPATDGHCLSGVPGVTCPPR